MAFSRDAFVQELETMTVLELKELVKALEEHFGIPYKEEKVNRAERRRLVKRGNRWYKRRRI